MQEDAERVLRTLSTIEREVGSTYSDARYVMRMMPYRTVDNVIAGVVITFVDVTKISAAEERIHELTHDLRNRVQSLESLLNLLPVGVLIMEDGGSGEVRINRYGARLIGEGDSGDGPLPMSDNLRVIDGGRELHIAEQPLQKAARNGEPEPGFEGRLIRPDGGEVDVLVLATPLFDDAGKPRGGIAAVLDISERKRAEAHQQVLLHELQHRVKNIIATIGALAQRMLRDDRPHEEFAPAFLGRLRAMANTHELLSRAQWAGADLRLLLEAALNPYHTRDGAEVHLDGPMLLLPPNDATALGMVFYELTTNAAKYGALSKSGGRIDASWRFASDGEHPRVVVSWRESGGPAVEAPLTPGFGSDFITRSVEYELGGRLTLDPNPAGLRCVIEFPHRRDVEDGGQTNGKTARDGPPGT